MMSQSNLPPEVTRTLQAGGFALLLTLLVKDSHSKCPPFLMSKSAVPVESFAAAPSPMTILYEWINPPSAVIVAFCPGRWWTRMPAQLWP